jgi:predicted nucleic acid-binding Zn ribbon protein
VEETLSSVEKAIARKGSIFRRAGWAITDYFKV